MTNENYRNTLNRRQVLKAGAIATVATVGMASTTVLAQAAAWPSKPIRFVVPFAPGGTSEIVARSVAAELTKQLGVSVFVENKPGGAGVVAMQDVRRFIQNRRSRKRDHYESKNTAQTKAEQNAGNNKTERDKTADRQNRT